MSDSNQGPPVDDGSQARFVAQVSTKYDRFVEEWRRRGDKRGEELCTKAFSTLSAALSGKTAEECHQLVVEECYLIQLRLESAWHGVCREFLSDVSVDLLQFGKQPLTHQEMLAVENQQIPSFEIPYVRPEEGTWDSIAGGAAAGGLAGSAFAGVGAVPGAILGGIGGLFLGMQVDQVAIVREAQSCVAKALELAVQKMRASKLDFIQQLLELRWQVKKERKTKRRNR